MNDRMEIQGKTVDEAVAEALLQMGARHDEVEITVLEEPKSGFMGILGNRMARVLVRRKPGKGGRKGNPLGLDDGYEAHDLSNRPSGRSRRGGQSPRNRAAKDQNKDAGQRGRGRDRNAAPRTKQPAPENRAPAEGDASRDGSSRRRRGRRSKPQPERAPRNESPQAASPEAASPKSSGQERRGRNRNDGDRKRSNNRPAPNKASAETAGETRRTRPAPTEPDKIIKTGIQSTKYAKPIRDIEADKVDTTLSELTEGMLIRAGFTCRCEVQPGEYSRVKLITDDASAGMLIGRHGSAIDAVEHLIERMAGMAAGERVRMNLDINNYRRRREEELLARAQGVISQVQESGRDYHFESMSARERRIVHLEVAEVKGVKTYTVAGSKGKHVVVALDDGEAGEKTRSPEQPGQIQDTENQMGVEPPGSEEQPQG